MKDVAAGLEVVRLGLDHPRPEPPLEDMALERAAGVEGHGIDAVEVLHALGDVSVRRLDDEVIVVRHQREGVDGPASLARDLAKQADEESPIGVVDVDRLLSHTARDHVVDAVRDSRAT
jgi:hypothetical protein